MKTLIHIIMQAIINWEKTNKMGKKWVQMCIEVPTHMRMLLIFSKNNKELVGSYLHFGLFVAFFGLQYSILIFERRCFLSILCNYLVNGFV